MSLSSTELQTLSRLMDEALDLPVPERTNWLSQLPQMFDALRPELEKWLAEPQGVETADFLLTLPKLGEWSQPNANDLATGSEVGPYRLIRELGHGGMGTVWLAERSDGVLKRTVALKLPHSALPQRQLAERFARERDILAALTHPNIARLYDAGVTTQGQPYLALEYVEGEPLLESCDRRQLGLRERITLFLQILAAVQYAHGQLVVHRDLKPSNILVTQEGDVKLLDFGIAKLLIEGQANETELTQLGGRALTLQYASPEQIMGQALGTASDVYSLGVVLFEFLTGTLPYRGKRDSRGALEDAILSAEPARSSQVEMNDADAAARGSTWKRLAKQLVGDIDTILLKALKKDPAQRYATAEALAQDLTRYLTGEAVHARPDSVWYRTSKFLRRNLLAVSAFAAVALALSVGLGVALRQTDVAQREAETAKLAQTRANEVIRFIGSIFTDTRPSEGKGSMATATELLTRAGDRVTHELSDNPVVAAELSAVIGEGFLNLGAQDQAIKYLPTAIARSSSSVGENNLLVLRTKRLLGRALIEKGDFPAASKLLPGTIALLKATLPDSAHDLILAMADYSQVEIRLGEQAGGLASARESVEIAQRYLGRNHEDTLSALAGYANRLIELNRSDEAVKVARDSVERARLAFVAHRPHPALISAERNLAVAIASSGNPSDVTELTRLVLEDSKALYVDDTLEICYAWEAHAQALNSVGRSQEAIVALRQAIDIYGRFVPGNTADKAYLLQSLGVMTMNARRYAEALQALTHSEDIIAKSGSPEVAINGLRRQILRAEALVYLGRFGEAETALARTDVQLPAGSDSEKMEVARDRLLIARFQGGSQNILRRRLQDLPPALNLPAPVAANASMLTVLANRLLDFNRVEEAHTMLVKAIASFKKMQVASSADMADALIGVGRVALARKENAQALHSFKEAYEFWNKVDPGNVWAAESAYWYGNALLAAGDSKRGTAMMADARLNLQKAQIPMLRELATK